MDIPMKVTATVYRIDVPGQDDVKKAWDAIGGIFGSCPNGYGFDHDGHYVEFLVSARFDTDDLHEQVRQRVRQAIAVPA